MRLKWELLRDNPELGVSGVTGVSPSNNVGFKRNTCSGSRVSGVSKSGRNGESETPETRDLPEVFREIDNLYAVETPVTPETPKMGMCGQDPSFWLDDFSKWALSECLFTDRGFGGIKVMHARFCDWCSDQGSVGCMLETFEALLEGEGLLVAGGLVSGLVLRDAMAFEGSR